MKPLVIYHGGDCTDGFAAAFAAWLKLGDEADYLPMQYGAKNYEYPSLNRDVYILDFSFPRSDMDYLFDTSKRVVWLDHHKTAFEAFDTDPNKPFYIEEPTVTAILHPSKSGALLAWEYFHPDNEVPMLIQHIDDRDRWQFKMTRSKDIHAALASYKPWSFEQWDQDLLRLDAAGYNFREESDALRKLYEEGSTILRAEEAQVKRMAKQKRQCCIYIRESGLPSSAEFKGLAVNTPMHMSEVGHELANESGTYGLVWYVGADNRVKCSLRSNGDYDVSAIARALGGGGHRNASGFETDFETLKGWLT